MANTIEILSAEVPVSMSDQWYELADIGHFFVQWRFEVLKKYLHLISDKKDIPLFEIGCGHGILRDQLEKEGYIIDACDLNMRALRMANQGKGRLMVYNIYELDQNQINKYPVIFLFDVLEHIRDDLSFLKAALNHLNYGYVFINVPAGRYLFSRYDDEVGHIRRYNVKKIKKLFREAGIHTVTIRYWGFLMVPVIIMRKIVLLMTRKKKITKRGFDPPNKSLHSLFKLLKRIENSVPFNPYTGTSLIAIGRKKK